MDATPHLLTDVKFSERRRGYDPEEVDNFLERVSTAVAQLQDKLRQATADADEAEARLAEAQRAQAQAEAKVDQLEADLAGGAGGSGQPVDSEAEAEQASRILLMAQKTADATIDDAKQTAREAVEQAEQKASSLLTEAEAEAAGKREEAGRQIEELVRQRRSEVQEEVGSLESVRDQVRADVDTLHEHLEAQRAQLEAGVDRLRALLDDPGAFRSLPTPDTSGLGKADLPVRADEPADDRADASGDGEAADVEPQDAAGSDAGLSADDSSQESTDAADATQGEGGGDSPDLATRTDAEPEPADETSDDDVGPESGGSAAESDFTGERLFAGRTEVDEIDGVDGVDEGGPPTQLFSPFAENQSDPLGQPDEAADAAMRAFFDAEFEEDAGPKRSRWRR